VRAFLPRLLAALRFSLSPAVQYMGLGMYRCGRKPSHHAAAAVHRQPTSFEDKDAHFLSTAILTMAGLLRGGKLTAFRVITRKDYSGTVSRIRFFFFAVGKLVGPGA